MFTSTSNSLSSSGRAMTTSSASTPFDADADRARLMGLFTDVENDTRALLHREDELVAENLQAVRDMATVATTFRRVFLGLLARPLPPGSDEVAVALRLRFIARRLESIREAMRCLLRELDAESGSDTDPYDF
ncbi:hypothetical protein EXIGLDRAFT_783358 [Exidia glandulosa HHB12029]|uniref:Uncharacterized protein n=1 Tax=Exidia glandulosa HHB12029 TaxID=1314781 RepID=A0A166N3Q0_EXIGL|nr:hypothetical protein EXIGLDRAFT_783358 [Exidia glandulosa HHB12029]